MPKPSIPRRRSRKAAFAKGEYYPKVDLSDVEDKLPSSWSSSSVVTPVEEPADGESVAAAEPARVEEEVMSPPVVYLEPPVAPVAPPAPVSPPAPAKALTPAAAPKAAPAAAPTPAPAALRLPASLDLLAARPLAAALLERRGKPITIDASAVGQIGAQCVQVLLSAKRTWETDGVPLSIVNCATRMIEDLKLIGIEQTLVTGELPQ
jgi:chemotaxis protein CheX